MRRASFRVLPSHFNILNVIADIHVVPGQLSARRDGQGPGHCCSPRSSRGCVRGTLAYAETAC